MRPGPPCSIGLVIAEMSDEQRELMNGALRNQRVRGSDITRALQSNGHAISKWSLAHHRRGDCSCPKV